MENETKPRRKSIYGDHRESIKPLHVDTVGDLKAALDKFPDDLPLFGEAGTSGAVLVWFNVGHDDEQLSIEEDDGTWTEWMQE